ncbi:hypothetical protein SAMN05421858_0518 [Haladaptatus litoreus]|uniref:Uncharacterized protein n=1 Tax=Haladaptatus litoreus TaxID=553468 RepID=A0A1N6VXF1_9EURY|nr:DUF6220 domain-containing protein [Haladaptatus litoreus]SIQ82306.1 hypothetical protein SAMN05421858_0518 [Haladaptatus litoreus]
MFVWFGVGFLWIVIDKSEIASLPSWGNMFTKIFFHISANPLYVAYSERVEKTTESESTTTRVRWARYCYLGTAVLLTLAVLIQIYIAGMAVFIDPARWSSHVAFGNVLPVFLALLFVLAFLGRLSRTHKGLPVLIFVLFFVQFSTAHRFGSLVGAVHPVNAVLIFWLSTVTIQRAWRWTGAK